MEGPGGGGGGSGISEPAEDVCQLSKPADACGFGVGRCLLFPLDVREADMSAQRISSRRPAGRGELSEQADAYCFGVGRCPLFRLDVREADASALSVSAASGPWPVNVFREPS